MFYFCEVVIKHKPAGLMIVKVHLMSDTFDFLHNPLRVCVYIFVSQLQLIYCISFPGFPFFSLLSLITKLLKHRSHLLHQGDHLVTRATNNITAVRHTEVLKPPLLRHANNRGLKLSWSIFRWL